ncbi:MAG: PEP-CTERM sorting domain-containing protein [Chlamydiales bacterium]|nr:PEP-CTERM sorting domain-containing protein [Chlamydiales bacterium]
MNRLFKIAQAGLAGLFLVATSSSSLEATITGVNNGGVIIAPPASVFDNPGGATGDMQQGFNEKQNVLVTDPIATDLGTIPVGYTVSSHMIFLNPAGGFGSHGNVSWTFDGIILGVMSDGLGNLEFASDAQLGNPGTAYPTPFATRGLEPIDGYFFVGNTLTLKTVVFPPDRGDWIRVVTLGVAVPEPSTYLLFGGFLSLAAFLKRRKTQVNEIS